MKTARTARPVQAAEAVEIDFSDLESQVCDVALMAGIACDLIFQAISADPTPLTRNPCYYYISKEQAERILLAAGDSVERARELKGAYFSALEADNASRRAAS